MNSIEIQGIITIGKKAGGHWMGIFFCVHNALLWYLMLYNNVATLMTSSEKVKYALGILHLFKLSFKYEGHRRYFQMKEFMGYNSYEVFSKILHDKFGTNLKRKINIMIK